MKIRNGAQLIGYPKSVSKLRLFVFLSTFSTLLLIHPQTSFAAISCNEITQHKGGIQGYLTSIFNDIMPTNQKVGSTRFGIMYCANTEAAGHSKRKCKKQELQKTSVHVINKREGEDQMTRIRVLSGKNKGACFITKNDTVFVCQKCNSKENRQCKRRASSDDSSSTVYGTNIDKRDFDFTSKPDLKLTCSHLKKLDGYLMIESTPIAKASARKNPSPTHDRIEVVIHAETKSVVLLRFYQGKQLMKVYRFFLGEYADIGGIRRPTATRVRSINPSSTTNKEDDYIAETITFILKDKRKGTYHWYEDLQNDPLIVDHRSVFNVSE